jgi:hypothetical protein
MFDVKLVSGTAVGSSGIPNFRAQTLPTEQLKPNPEHDGIVRGLTKGASSPVESGGALGHAL